MRPTAPCLAVIKRSNLGTAALPDLFCFAHLGALQGLRPWLFQGSLPKEPELPHVGGAEGAYEEPRRVVVTLRSADPREDPDVNFRYFDESSDTRKRDLASIIVEASGSSGGWRRG